MVDEVDAQFVRQTNEFALQLSKQIFSSTKENVVISPFSISTCLSFAAMGAGGNTLEEIFSVLNYGKNTAKLSIAKHYGDIMALLKENKSLKIANKVYVMQDYTIKPNFNEIATKNFQSEAETVDFKENIKAAKQINEWVEKKTNSKIKDLITPDALDTDTRMVLVNAIHFKGTWTYQFDPARTRPMPFWVTATESIDVPMMNIKKHFNYGVFEDLNMAALELTYNDSDVSMLILLPDKRDGLPELENKLLSLDIASLKSKMHSTEVELHLPRFKIEFNLDLNNALKKLGMEAMFSDSADFSELLEQSEPLKVSKVIHKAFIEVNEEGAEAAAATAIVALGGCCFTRSLPALFQVNHPFYYLLVPFNPTIIHFGRILKPLAK